MLKRLLSFFLLLISIQLSAVNSSPTGISLSQDTISENRLVGVVIGSFSSADLDVADVHTYSLVAGAGSVDNAKFSIIGNQLLTNAVFNFESAATRSIRVQTNDGNGGIFSAVFSITILNVNEWPTNIVLSQNKVDENLPLGSLVGNLSSSDPDLGNTFTYSLVAGTGSSNNALFTILGNQLKTNSVFNYEVIKTYSIRVQTTDNNGGVYQRALSVLVNDVNENPVYNDASASIAENSASATVVLNTSASDVDAGQTITYSIVSGNTGGAFSINSSTGQISVANSSALNYEVTPLFNLVVRATDNGTGSLFDNATITITITNVNDSPIFTVPGAQNVNEFTNLPISPIVLTDEDIITDSVSISITASHGLFSLNSLTGLRFVAGDGVNDNLLGFYGSLADVSAAISSIVYKSYDDYVGSDQILLGMRDYGYNNNGGITIIRAIDITVNPIPVTFNVQTVGATICQSREHLFFVNTSGTGPMTYQWKFNGSDLVGETNDSLRINNADLSHVGVYKCVVTNPAGVFSSTLVNLVVNATPKIDFTFNNACVGSSTSFVNSSQIDYDAILFYTWDFDDNNTTSNISDPSRVFSADGSYDVSLVVQSNLGCKDTLVKTVVVYPYPVTNFSAGDICFVDTLKPINNTTINFGTITYSWNFGDGYSSSQKNPSHKYVSTDSYIIGLTSTSNNGCSTSKTQTITVNPSPIANFVVSDICDSTDAKFQGVSSISSGTITHYWNFGDGDTNYNEINPVHQYVGAATYQIQLKVVSDKMCSDSVVKDIKVFNNPTLNISVQDATCFGAATGAIDVLSSMGMAPYFYSLNQGNFTLNPTFYYLAAGNYSVLVMDNRNCVTKQMVEVKQPDLLTYSIENLNNIKCAGANTGSYVVVPKGGTAPYSYYINEIDSDSNIYKFRSSDTGYVVNLAAKIYPNYLIDHNGCKTKFSVEITQPSPISLSATHGNVTCKGLSDGVIDLQVAGGIGSYSYSISGGPQNQLSKVFSNLTAKDYLVSVKDLNGCGKSMNVNLLEPSVALSTQAFVQQNVSCFGDSTAVVHLSSVGGTGVVQYSMSNLSTFSTNSVYTKLPMGNYKIYAHDQNSCLDSVVFTITEPASAVDIQNVIVDDVKCFGKNDASITVAAAGGTGALKYTIDNYFQNNNIFSNLFSGTFNLKVKDVNGCIDSQLVTIAQPTALKIKSVSVGGVNCKNDLSGSLNFTVSGGVLPYQYTVGSNSQYSPQINLLSGGMQHASVLDQNGCSLDTVIDVPFAKDVVLADFHPFVAGKVIIFNDLSQNAVSYAWDFGDGFQSNSSQPIHQYASNGIYNVTLKVSNECNSDSIKKMVNIGSVDTEELNALSINLYPNPCTDFIVVDASFLIASKGSASTIKVYNMLGEIVSHENFVINQSNMKIHFSTETLPSGKYLMRLENSECNVVKTFEVIR